MRHELSDFEWSIIRLRPSERLRVTLLHTKAVFVELT